MSSTAIAVKGAQQYLAPVQAPLTPEKQTPYVTFAFPVADKFAEMAAAIPGLASATPVLFDGKKYQKLDPLRAFFVRTLPQVWVERDQGRAVIDVTLTPQEFGSPLIEEIHAVVLALTPSGLQPAVCTFKKAACRGAKTVVAELNTVNDAVLIRDWIAKSGDHKAAAAIPYPFGRFVATVKSFMKPPKGGKGKPYHMTQASCSPTTASEAAQLAKFFTDEESVEALNAAVAFAQSRYDALVELAK